MDEYPINSVKQDAASGFVAIRTGFTDGRDWMVVSLSGVRHYVQNVDVAGWRDLKAIESPL